MSRRPSRISLDDAGLLLGWQGWRLGGPDAAQEHRRDDERDRVDCDRDRRGQDLDEPAADTEPDELRRGAAASQRRVRVDEPLATDDGRQEGAVGGVEERRQDRGTEGNKHQLDERQGVQGEGERDRGQQGGPAQIGPDHDRPPPEPVDPGPCDQPEGKSGDELGGPQDRDLARARA